ncbi:MAG: exosortase-associated EpsI family protein [Planctomycetaceae bacterium]
MSRSRKNKKKKGRKPAGAVGDHQQRASDEPAASPWRIWLPGVASCLVLLIGGVAHGLLTHRWTESTELREAAARLQSIPTTIGDWESSELTIPATQLKQAGAVGHVHRVYRNRKTDEVVNVMLLCGHPGPISVHPPTVCFTGAGWQLQDGPSQTTIHDREAKSIGRFHTALFQRTTPTGDVRMQTVWSWNAGGKWEVPDHPRFEFAGAGHLYKLYVTRVMPETPGGRETESVPGGDADPVASFLRALAVELKKAGI